MKYTLITSKKDFSYEEIDIFKTYGFTFAVFSSGYDKHFILICKQVPIELHTIEDVKKLQDDFRGYEIIFSQNYIIINPR